MDKLRNIEDIKMGKLKKKNIQNIVHIKSYGKYDDHMFLIMEKLPYTLNDYIQTENDLKDICNQMYTIIQTLHSHGIMHRDIKPENILWDPRGKTVKLSDFGISGFVKFEMGGDFLTSTGGSLGVWLASQRWVGPALAGLVLVSPGFASHGVACALLNGCMRIT